MQSISLITLLFVTIISSVVYSAPIPQRRCEGCGAINLIYQDQYGGQTAPPSADKIKGFNVYALSFYMSKGPTDKAQEFAKMSAEDRAAKKKEYADAGIKMIVSLFGAEDHPTKDGADPGEVAAAAAKFVKDYDLDGVDVDYEDPAMDNSPEGPQWVIDLTKALRKELPAGQYLLTHAPQAPWFSPNFEGGPYLKVHKEVGDLIDAYNVQYYNQGTDYSTCDHLITKSRDFSGTSVLELMKQGIPANKIIIGKPATSGDAGTGFMETSVLAQCHTQARNKGWTGGWMTWEYPNGDTKWINAINPDAAQASPLTLGNSDSVPSEAGTAGPTATDSESPAPSAPASADGEPSQDTSPKKSKKQSSSPSSLDDGSDDGSSSTKDGSSSSSSSDNSGQVFSDGIATYFTQGGVAGACGTVHSDDDLIAAIDQARYGNSGEKSSLCGKKVKITSLKDSKTVTVTIADDCPTCKNADSIDLSVAAFKALAPLDQGVVPIKWEFV